MHRLALWLIPALVLSGRSIAAGDGFPIGRGDRQDSTSDRPDVPPGGDVVALLRDARMPADSEPIRRGLAWLKANQRASGRWLARSLSNDHAHDLTHTGTAFALMALSACEAD